MNIIGSVKLTTNKNENIYFSSLDITCEDGTTITLNPYGTPLLDNRGDGVHVISCKIDEIIVDDEDLFKDEDEDIIELLDGSSVFRICLEGDTDDVVLDCDTVSLIDCSVRLEDNSVIGLDVDDASVNDSL